MDFRGEPPSVDIHAIHAGKAPQSPHSPMPSDNIVEKVNAMLAILEKKFGLTWCWQCHDFHEYGSAARGGTQIAGVSGGVDTTSVGGMDGI
jgi:hypothetical protein